MWRSLLVVAVVTALVSAQTPVNPCDGLSSLAVPLGTQRSGSTNANPVTYPALSPACGSAAADSGHWYSFTGANAYAVVKVVGGITGSTTFDPYVKLFSCVTPTILQCEGYSDDRCGSKDSELSFFGQTGVVYYIFVSGYQGTRGPYTVSVEQQFSCGVTINPCSLLPGQAIPTLTMNEPLAGSIAGAVMRPEVCIGSQLGVWYRVVGDGSFMYLSAKPTDNQPFRNPTIDVATCNTTSEIICFDYSDDHCFPILAAGLSFQSVVGQNYYVWISEVGSAVGEAEAMQYEVALTSELVIDSCPVEVFGSDIVTSHNPRYYIVVTFLVLGPLCCLMVMCSFCCFASWSRFKSDELEIKGARFHDEDDTSVSARAAAARPSTAATTAHKPQKFDLKLDDEDEFDQPARFSSTASRR